MTSSNATPRFESSDFAWTQKVQESAEKRMTRLGTSTRIERPVQYPGRAGVMGARWAWAVSMISALSMPCREIEVVPRLVWPS